ncbi:MAG: carbohydrate ABC transporter permease [Clostridiaceae bacterium]|nr:carbohydrate ABC transporter permease [Clostridiaceae bacterium]
MEKQRKRTDLIIEIIVIFFSLIIIVPILIMVFGSFKDSTEAAKFNILPPKEWHFENYVYVITVGNIGRALINSLVVTFFSVLFCMVPASLAGFIIARRTTKISSRSQTLFMIGLYAPMNMITTFALLRVTGLLGSYFAVIMVLAASQIPYAVYMVSNFVRNVPRELDQAALIDGCSSLRMFFTIITPVMKPILVTTTVLVTMNSWNDFMVPLYFFNTSSRWTLPLTVYNFYGQYFRDWNLVFANLVITALPITILYLYAQKHIVSGLTSGAVKG